MKALISILFILFCFSLFSFDNKNKDAKKAVEKILIIKVSSTIQTTVSISCDIFDSVWFHKKDTVIIFDPNKIKKILYCISLSKPAPEFYNSIDTRAKMSIFYKSGKVDKVCLGSTTIILINGISRDLGKDDLLQMVY